MESCFPGDIELITKMIDPDKTFLLSNPKRRVLETSRRYIKFGVQKTLASTSIREEVATNKLPPGQG